MKILSLSAIITLLGGTVAQANTTIIPDIRGVNFIPELSSNEQYNEKSMMMIKEFGFNTVRIPVYWETHKLLGDDSDIIAIERVVQLAQNSGLYVIIVNHQYNTSSFFTTDGLGFPTEFVDLYKTQEGFWKDFYNNKDNIWLKHWFFLKHFVVRFEKYDNVLGYEILNSPPIYNPQFQLPKLGTYYTFIAKKIDELSDKLIFFDKPIYPNHEKTTFNFENKITPKNIAKSRLVYVPNFLTEQPNIDDVHKKATLWNVSILVGEFGDVTHIDTFKENSFGWIAWSWGGTGSFPLVTYQNGEVIPTEYLSDLVSEMN